MSNRPWDVVYLYGLLCKFPVFDPAWPAEVVDKWLRAFEELLARGESAEREACEKAQRL